MCDKAKSTRDKNNPEYSIIWDRLSSSSMKLCIIASWDNMGYILNNLLMYVSIQVNKNMSELLTILMWVKSGGGQFTRKRTKASRHHLMKNLNCRLLSKMSAAMGALSTQNQTGDEATHTLANYVIRAKRLKTWTLQKGLT